MISRKFRVGPSALVSAAPPEEPHAPCSVLLAILAEALWGERAENKRAKEGAMRAKLYSHDLLLLTHFKDNAIARLLY